MPKRNAHGSGTIRQRPDGRWEARYTTGRDGGTGKQVQKSVYGDTQAEVRRKLSAATAAIDAGTYLEPSRLSVGAWLDIWLSTYMDAVKPRTRATYAADVRNHIKPSLGAVKMVALNAHTIQGFYNGLLRKEKPLSPKSIKNIHGCFHKALKQAVILGYIRFNPADGCTLPRIERTEIKPLDESEISAFLEASKDSKYAIIYRVAIFTGMRQGELLGLTWDCVDFKNGTVTINKQLQRLRGGSGGYHLVAPKNDKPRIITPAETVMQLLRKQKAWQAEWKLKLGAAWENERNLVFTNELGGNLAPQTVYANFKRIAEGIGRPDARFHDLRHTYAVAALRAGDNIKAVQEALGHHTAAFTLDTYAHVTGQMKQDSAARMERYINALSEL